MTRLPLFGRVAPSRRAGLVLLLLLVASGALACGPSFQAVYEGDQHFEHCYAMDERAVPDDKKKECWREWLRGYTFGQSNDRVEYAATRFSQLSLDATLPSEDVRDAGPRRPRKAERTVAAPIPTNAFAPPPKVNTDEARQAPDASSPAQHPPPIARVPGSDCTGACEDRWSACRGGCADHGCEACDRPYRACMSTCFHEDAGAPKGK